MKSVLAILFAIGLFAGGVLMGFSTGRYWYDTHAATWSCTPSSYIAADDGLHLIDVRCVPDERTPWGK